MSKKSFSIAKVMGCCSCFGFIRKFKRRRGKFGIKHNLSQEPLLDRDREEDDDGFSSGNVSDVASGDDNEVPIRARSSEEILKLREENDMICRKFPVKETNKVVRSEVVLIVALKYEFRLTLHLRDLFN